MAFLKRSNCLVEAVRLWLRNDKQGYLCIRKSLYWFGPHVLYLEKEGWQFKHYVPLKPKRRMRWWQCWRLMLFEGQWITGDREDYK